MDLVNFVELIWNLPSTQVHYYVKIRTASKTTVEAADPALYSHNWISGVEFGYQKSVIFGYKVGQAA